jgi:RNase P subunit RPR2
MIDDFRDDDARRTMCKRCTTSLRDDASARTQTDSALAYTLR